MLKKLIIISSMMCLLFTVGEATAVVLSDNSDISDTGGALHISAPQRQYSYSFFQGMDSGGNDIIQRADLAGNIMMLKNICDKTPNCAGFNTTGWLKFRISPQAQWVHFSNDPNLGLYVKN